LAVQQSEVDHARAMVRLKRQQRDELKWIERLRQHRAPFIPGRMTTWTRAASTRVLPDHFDSTRLAARASSKRSPSITLIL
jgi:hypothetical protein